MENNVKTKENEFKDVTILTLSDEIEDLCPRKKLVSMLHVDGWNSDKIFEYFKGSIWEFDNIEEVDQMLQSILDLLHKYIEY